MTKLITTLFAALLLMAGFTASASASCQGKAHDVQKSAHGKGMGYGHGYGNYDKDAMVKTLGLTDDQRSEVKGIWTNVQKDSITLGAEIKKAGIDIGAALSGKEPDFKGAKAASQQLGKLKVQIKENYFNALESTYKLLSAEQKKNWGQAMKDFRSPAAKKECPLKGTKECPLGKKSEK